MLGHGLGQDGVDGLLGEGTHVADEPADLDDLFALHARDGGVLGDDVVGDAANHVFGDVADLLAQVLRDVEDRVHGHAVLDELAAGVQQAGAGHTEPQAVAFDHPEVQGPLHRPRGDALAEEASEVVEGQVVGDLVAPGVADRGLEPEDVGEVAAALPDLEHLPDVGEGVAAAQELADQPQPGQVRLGV